MEWGLSGQQPAFPYHTEAKSSPNAANSTSQVVVLVILVAAVAEGGFGEYPTAKQSVLQARKNRWCWGNSYICVVSKQNVLQAYENR